MIRGLSLLCPLSWDWVDSCPWTLAHPPSPKAPRAKGFSLSQSQCAECWVVHLASSRVGGPAGGVGDWLITVVGLLEDWEGHRFLPSPPPPPAATECRLWLPSSPMGGCNRGGNHRWLGGTIHPARAIQGTPISTSKCYADNEQV